MKPIPTKLIKKYFKSKGLVCQRTEGSHEIWDFPKDKLMRPIVIRSKEKEVPIIHIISNLKTLGIDYKTFEEEIKNL